MYVLILSPFHNLGIYILYILLTYPFLLRTRPLLAHIGKLAQRVWVVRHALPLLVGEYNLQEKELCRSAELEEPQVWSAPTFGGCLTLCSSASFLIVTTRSTCTIHPISSGELCGDDYPFSTHEAACIPRPRVYLPETECKHDPPP